MRRRASLAPGLLGKPRRVAGLERSVWAQREDEVKPRSESKAKEEASCEGQSPAEMSRGGLQQQ